MITTLLSKVRQQFGLAPTATLSQINEAMDANTQAAPDEGAAAGASEATETDTAPAAEPTEGTATADTLTRETVAEMIATAVAATEQSITDLNAVNAELTEANAALSARLAVVEGQDAEGHTSGKVDAVEIAAEVKPLYTQNPINQRASDRLAGKK